MTEPQRLSEQELERIRMSRYAHDRRIAELLEHIVALQAELEAAAEREQGLREALLELAERAEYFAASAPRHPQNAEILAGMARAALSTVPEPAETEQPSPERGGE
jgi:hypothetical protein